MAQAETKKTKKFFILASLGLIIPVFILSIAFIAAKSDAKTKKEYDKIRLEHEAKIEKMKQQNKGTTEQVELEKNHLSSPNTNG